MINLVAGMTMKCQKALNVEHCKVEFQRGFYLATKKEGVGGVVDLS